MPWTTRFDDSACCGNSPGSVNDNEPIARLLHSRISDPISAAFNRTQLTRPDDGAFSNGCGDADGCSVDRAAKLTESDLRERALSFAEQRPGREAQGAIVALASDLRGIECTADPKGRAVYIYDDPMAENAEHAVVRLSQHLPREDFQAVRLQMIAAFRWRVHQTK